jgi:hypothetical protein
MRVEGQQIPSAVGKDYLHLCLSWGRRAGVVMPKKTNGTAAAETSLGSGFEAGAGWWE